MQTYPSAEGARQVVLAFGIEEKVVDETLKLLPDAGPIQPLFFTPKDVPRRVLWDHGFKTLEIRRQAAEGLSVSKLTIRYAESHANTSHHTQISNRGISTRTKGDKRVEKFRWYIS